MTIAEYLKKNDLSYAAFARLLGLRSTSAQMNVYRWANRQRFPRPETAQKIVDLTKKKVTLADIYGGAP